VVEKVMPIRTGESTVSLFVVARRMECWRGRHPHALRARLCTKPKPRISKI
jgi:hypothetical protein